MGENGIFGLAENGTEEYRKQTATEKINLKITTSQMNKYATEQRMPTLQELANDFCEDSEIEYVEPASKKIASLNRIDLSNKTSFFTKLKDYPYEFEINSSLQLASIDGVRIASNDTQNGELIERIEALEQKVEKQNATIATLNEQIAQEIAKVQVNGIYDTIYEGSVSGNNSTASWSKSINDYKYIIVYASNKDGTIITSEVVDKSCYNFNVINSQQISAFHHQDWKFVISYYFTSDKSLRITETEHAGWSAYDAKIFLIKGVK